MFMFENVAMKLKFLFPRNRRCPRQVDTSRREAVSQSELREEDDFLDEVLKTDVMSETMRFHHLMVKYV